MNGMKFTHLLGIAFCLAAGPGVVKAQSASVINPPRLIVESPSAIAGSKIFTYSSNSAGAGPWGGALTPRMNEEIVRVSDSEACNTVQGANGKWVLIYRGNCEFGLKALNAQNGGAIGVVIWNHTQDELINMGAGASGAPVNIPVLFVSKQDGMAINNQLLGGQQVFLSITPWGFGKTHDLAFVGGSAAAPPGMAIPLNQLDGTDVPAYRGYTAAVVANTGLSDETTVKIKSEVSFTPQSGGAATPFHTDSAVLASFPLSDSIQMIYSPRNFRFTPTQTGMYHFDYTLTADDADEYTYDNIMSTELAVTNNVFCRGRYDMNAGRPVISGYSRIGAQSEPWSWGPMFYVKKGGYQLREIQFALSDRDTAVKSFPSPGSGPLIDIYVYKWTDANGDKIIQGDEIALKGLGLREFKSNIDSPKQLMTVSIGDVSGLPGEIVAEDDSYYWVAFNLGVDLSLGVDRITNYYTRAYTAAHGTQPSFDYWGPGLTRYASPNDILPTDIVKGFPYGVSSQYSSIIDSASYDQQSSVPAVGLVIGQFLTSTPNVNKTESFMNIYPNPAVNTINASVKFDKATDGFVKIMDNMGRQVSVEKFSAVKEGNIPVNISALVPGNYYLVVIADGKIAAKPFTRIK